MGKTSTQENVQQIDPDLRKEAEQVFNLSHMISGMGYNPYQGVNIAARTPMQDAAVDATNTAASAFGMPTAARASMPTPTSQDGILGYSTQQMAEDQAGYDDLNAKIQQIFQEGAKKPEWTGGPQLGGGGKK